jgi:very-short-patch-repair endonuclease
MKHLYNNPKLKRVRIKLRQDQTPHEAFLWSKLRNRKLENFRFVRQYSLEKYVLDFYCPTKKLAIELDGSQHANPENVTHDNQREKYLNSFGVTVLRFPNYEARYNLDHVLDKIIEALND